MEVFKYYELARKLKTPSLIKQIQHGCLMCLDRDDLVRASCLLVLGLEAPVGYKKSFFSVLYIRQFENKEGV